MTKPPIPEEEQFEVSDEFEAKLKKMKKGQYRHNLGVIQDLMKSIDKENLPERHEKSLKTFFMCQKHKLLAEIEKTHEGKVKELKKALEFARDNDVGEINIAIAVQEAQAVLSREERGHDVKPKEIISILKRSIEKLRNTKNKKASGFLEGMVMVYEAGELAAEDKRPESLNKIEEAALTFKKNNFIDGYYKFKSLQCTVEAKFQPDPKESLKLMKKSKKWLEKTSDKYSLIQAEADIYWLEGIITNKPIEKAKFFEKAGDLYQKTDLKDLKVKGSELKAEAYKIMSHKPELDFKEVLKFQQKAADEYKKAGPAYVRPYHNMRGAYYATLAIVRGMIESKERLFVKYAFQAVSEYDKAGNRREADSFVGQLALKFGSFSDSYEKKIEYLEMAVNAFARTSLPLSKLAEFQLYESLASNELDTSLRKELLVKAIKALEVYLNFVDSVQGSSKRMEEHIKRGEASILLLKSEMHKIRAEIAPDETKRGIENSQALLHLEEADRSGEFSVDEIQRRVAMVHIANGDYDLSIQCLEKASSANPGSKQVSNMLSYAQNLIKTGYRKYKDEFEMMREFDAKSTKMGVTYTSAAKDFVPTVLRLVCKKGFQIEEMPRSQVKKSENELRDELLLALGAEFTGDATAESFVGDGKTDIRVKNPLDSSDKFIIECKWWTGPKAYDEAKEQLFRYLPPQQNYGCLVTFIKQKKFAEVFESAKKRTEKMNDYVHNSIEDWPIIKRDRDFFFISKHNNSKGGTTAIYHIFFLIV